MDIQKRRNITLNIFILFLEINTKYSNWVLVHVYFDKDPISHDKFSHVSVNKKIYMYGREGRLHLPKVQRKDLRNCWTRPGLVHHIHLTQHKLARSFYFEFCNIYLLLCLASVFTNPLCILQNNKHGYIYKYTVMINTTRLRPGVNIVRYIDHSSQPPATLFLLFIFFSLSPSN